MAMNEHSSGSQSHSSDAADHIDGEAFEAKRYSYLRRRAPQLITSAQRTPFQNRRRRETVYSILQVVRVPLMVLAAVVWGVWDLWWLGLLIMGVSIPMPGIAVVIANERGQRKDKREQSVYKPAAARLEAQRVALEAQRRQEIEAAQPTENIIDNFDEEDEDRP